MKRKENFVKSFASDYGYTITIILFVFSIGLPILIWYLLLNQYEKGAESSWAIGVGLLGSLISGLCTLIAFLVSNNQTKKIQKENIDFTKKQLKLIILNDKITEYKKLKSEFIEIYKKALQVKQSCQSNLGYNEVLFIELDDFIKQVREFRTNLYCINDVNTKDTLGEIIDCLYKVSLEILTYKYRLSFCADIYIKKIEEFSELMCALHYEDDRISKIMDEEIMLLYKEKYMLVE